MPRRLLIVEDDPDNALVFKLVFEHAGYVVLHAPDLATARALLDRGPPDLAVLDLILPDGDALDFCIELRARVPPIRVIVVSAWDEERLREAAIEHCADLFVTKPFDPDRLEREADRLCRGAGAARGGKPAAA